MHILRTTLGYYAHNNYVNIHADGPETGDVRLMYGTYGRVDTFLSGIWVPVTDSLRSWTHQNSKIVCRELGYNG